MATPTASPPIFFGYEKPAPAGLIERAIARMAVALIERGTPLAYAIDMLPIALIAAGIYLALW